MSRVRLFDTFQLRGGIRKTEDGFLAANARVARTGIQVYRGFEVGRPDLDKVRVYRPPSEVFKHDAMKSFAHRPVTFTHPPESVRSTNWEKYAIGHTDGEVVRDGNYIRVPMVMMDQAAIDQYEKHGVKELSMGYSTDLDWTAGKTEDGETYDAVQRNIKANHLAVVPVARGGEALRIGDQRVRARAIGWDLAKVEGKPLAFHIDSGSDGDDGDDWDKNSDEHHAKGDDPDDDDETADAAPYFFNDEWPGDYRRPFRHAVYDRDVSEKERKSLAKQGKALPGGGFPIKSEGDLKNAIRAIGRAKNPAAAKALIKRRARALGKSDLIPEDWNDHATDASPGTSTSKGVKGMRTITLDDIPLELEDRDAAVVLAHIARLTKRLADQKAELDAKKADDEEDDEENTRAMDALRQAVEKRDGEIAQLKAALKDADMGDIAKLNAMVAARAAVINGARLVLGDKAVTMDDPRPSPAIIKDALTKMLGADAVKGMSDPYAEAYFHGAVSRMKDGKGGGGDNGHQRVRTADGTNNDSLGGSTNADLGNDRLRDAIAEANLRRGFADSGTGLDAATTARDNAFRELAKRSQDAWRSNMGQGLPQSDRQQQR